ncbi:hypothetical protein SAMN05421743_1123 [Thalassobacillus cyri]|uniref:Uncharacterized protein n=1 Tax=Thalassobacillus cyri TaxID=571932 RepID=A0A1H4FNG1_9BACI|nr:hypothetical protein [Thalassobacillus cyri]SEA98350.1 hypothetical protein SAMN05421743_1123 [Thalassobacillus cyri]
MKTSISVLAVVAILLFASFLESPTMNTRGGTFAPSENAEETSEVSGQSQENEATAYTSLESVLVESKELDGYLVEAYQEIEIYKDKQGNIVKRVPTYNYDYIKYKIGP